MTDKKDNTTENSSSSNNTDNANEEQQVHNPFDENDGKKITTEDIENEQMFKEAQTERD